MVASVQVSLNSVYARPEPCTSVIRRQRQLLVAPSPDVLAHLTEEYARLVECLLDPRASCSRIEYAYSRLLGVRGNLCRLSPLSLQEYLPERTRRRWEWADIQLRDYLGRAQHIEDIVEIAQRVEVGYTEGVERYLLALTRMEDADIPNKLGILKGIDMVGMHLAQRELFAQSKTFAIPLEDAQTVKLRVRLIALFLTLHPMGFSPAIPAIHSYRDTFQIRDPRAYPWWFPDCRLSERQLNWNYRRLPLVDLDWRF